MRVETVAAFLTGDIHAEVLNSEALKSIACSDKVKTAMAIIDIDRPLTISRDHLIRLCDAAIDGKLSEASLNAFALTASNLSMHKNWLSGISKPPARPQVPRGLNKGKLISQRLKVKELRPDWASYSEILRKLEIDA